MIVYGAFWPLALLLRSALASPDEVPKAPPPCPEEGICRAPEDWRFAWVSDPKKRKVVAYEVGVEHLRKDEKARFGGEVTVFLSNGEVRRGKGGSTEQAAYGCAGKLLRPSFQLNGPALDVHRGSWALVYAGAAKERPPLEDPRRISGRIRPEYAPSWLRAALADWKLPSYAKGAAPNDSIVPLEIDGDPEPEYWVTRTYTREKYEEPAPRMYASFALFDKDGKGAKALLLVEEDECDCLCRDGGCGCCRWDEVTTTPVALFDLEGDGISEIILERHYRVGQYRYELWRYNGRSFVPTSLFYEDGSC